MAGRGLGTLTLDLILKMGGFEQGLDKAGRALDKRGKQMEARARTIGKAIGIGITAGFAAGGALAVAIKSSIDRMDELSKAAQRASLPTEQFTQLAYAGSLADVSMEDLTKSLGKLAKAQGDAAAGLKTQNDAFNQLGIAFKNADGSLRSTKEVFLDFADAFQKYKGSPEVVAAGMQIFGRSFQTLIPLLKDGREGLQAAADEADRLGVTLSTKAGQEAEAFNDNLTRLKSATNGLFQSIAAELLPELVKLTDQFVAIASSGDDAKEIASGIATTFRVVGTVVSGISSFFTQLGNVIEGVTEGFIGLKIAALGVINLDFDKIKQGLYVADQGAARARNPRDPETKNVPQVIFAGDGKEPLGFFRNSAPTFTPPPVPGTSKSGKRGGGGKSDAEREAEQLQRAYDSLVASQKEQIALFGETGEAAKARYDTELGALKDLPAAQKAVIVANAERLDQMAQEKTLQDAAAAAVQRNSEAYARQREAIKSQIGDMQFELQLLGLSNVEREKAIALRYAGADATDAERAAIGKLAEQLDAARKANDLYNEAQRSLSDAMFDAISGAKSLKDAFLDLVDNIEAAILRSITDNWAEQIGSWFKSSTSSSSSDSGGGGFWAGLIGSLFGGGKASGGTVMPGKFYRVAENGPEMLSMGGRQYLMTGNQSGRVDPNPNMGRGLTVNQTLVSQTPFTMRSAMQLQQEAAFKLRQATARS